MKKEKQKNEKWIFNNLQNENIPQRYKYSWKKTSIEKATGYEKKK